MTMINLTNEAGDDVAISAKIIRAASPHKDNPDLTYIQTDDPRSFFFVQQTPAEVASILNRITK